jgi:hypothetical protein
MYSGLEYRDESACVNGAEKTDRHVGTPGWTPVIHRDIKPAKICLRSPADPNSSYPNAVLGDLDNLLQLTTYDDKPKSNIGLLAKGDFYSGGYAAPVSLLAIDMWMSY